MKCLLCDKEYDHADDMAEMNLKKGNFTQGYCRACRKFVWNRREKVLRDLKEKGEYKDKDVTIH